MPDTPKPDLALPDTNPKTRAGALKAPVHFVPPIFAFATGQALAHGAPGYGPYNWRETGITASTYMNATRRHLDAHWDGETLDPESGLPHLWHAAANLAIWIDATSLGLLNDDRPPPGALPALLAARLASGVRREQ